MAPRLRSTFGREAEDYRIWRSSLWLPRDRMSASVETQRPGAGWWLGISLGDLILAESVFAVLPGPVATAVCRCCSTCRSGVRGGGSRITRHDVALRLTVRSGRARSISTDVRNRSVDFSAAMARLVPMLLSCRSKAFQDVNGAANAISLSEPELSIIQHKKPLLSR